MAHLATDDFLAELRALYPRAPGPATPAGVLANPWYLVAAVAFSASKRAAAVPAVWAFAAAELAAAQGAEHASEQSARERLALVRKIREALLQSGLLSGMPRTIDSCIALHAVTPPELRETKLQREPVKSMEEYDAIGKKLFHSMYRETADGVQSLLDSAYADLGWWCSFVGYGVTYGGTDILTQVETSLTIVAALIAVDAPRQIVWHLANAQHGGATLEEAVAARRIAMAVAEKSGIAWSDGVPEVVPV